jgi:hypothetical protein
MEQTAKTISSTLAREARDQGDALRVERWPSTNSSLVGPAHEDLELLAIGRAAEQDQELEDTGEVLGTHVSTRLAGSAAATNATACPPVICSGRSRWGRCLGRASAAELSPTGCWTPTASPTANRCGELAADARDELFAAVVLKLRRLGRDRASRARARTVSLTAQRMLPWSAAGRGSRSLRTGLVGLILDDDLFDASVLPKHANREA